MLLFMHERARRSRKREITSPRATARIHRATQDRRVRRLSRFENELLKNSITPLQAGRARAHEGVTEEAVAAPPSGNGGASSDWSARVEIVAKLVIITPEW